MKLQRVRLLAAVVLTALAAYLAIGHALHSPSMADGKPMHGAGICLVLLAASATLVVPRTRGHVLSRVPPVPGSPARVSSWRAPRPFVHARGSPAWLQRFLT
jgi:hypothetical protein